MTTSFPGADSTMWTRLGDQGQLTVGGSLEGWEIALILAVVGALVVGAAWPVLRGLGNRLGGSSARQLDERVARLESIVDELTLSQLGPGRRSVADVTARD